MVLAEPSCERFERPKPHLPYEFTLVIDEGVIPLGQQIVAAQSRVDGTRVHIGAGFQHLSEMFEPGHVDSDSFGKYSE